MWCNALRCRVLRTFQGPALASYRSNTFSGIRLMTASGEYRTITMSSDTTRARTWKQNFDFFLVLDFEATCDNGKPIKPQEVIEFPVLKVNAKTSKVESTFHQYVLPEIHPRLTPFCTELTGIVQDMVDGQPHLPEVLENFHQWMISENLLDPGVKSIFVTCGDWDLKVMLPKQCNYFGISTKNYLNHWINIKKAFAELTGVFPKGMFPMLNDLKLKHIGRHHSGIDDCQNIANILTAMIERNYVFHQTGSL